MSDVSKWHLMTYDVREAKRLRKVAKTLEGYGERVQFSVFRVRATATVLEKIKWEITQIMKGDDHFLVIPLCDRCAAKVDKHSIGESRAWGEAPPTFEIM